MASVKPKRVRRRRCRFRGVDGVATIIGLPIKYHPRESPHTPRNLGVLVGPDNHNTWFTAVSRSFVGDTGMFRRWYVNMGLKDGAKPAKAHFVPTDITKLKLGRNGVTRRRK